MTRYKIGNSPDILWGLFEDEQSGFSLPVGSLVAAALSLVRKVFIDIFGQEYVDSFRELSVVYAPDGPMTFRRNHIIFLSSCGLDFPRHIFQFSHELCHYMISSEVCTPYRWLEETLCQLMSWFVLQRISEFDDEELPENWRSFKKSIPDYLQRDQAKRLWIEGLSVPAFITQNINRLQKDCYLRSANRTIAYALYPLFLEAPDLWKIVPHMNKLRGNMELSAALSMLLLGANIEKVWGDKLINTLCEQ